MKYRGHFSGIQCMLHRQTCNIRNTPTTSNWVTPDPDEENVIPGNSDTSFGKLCA
jgi:hypothetical protein